MFQMCANYGKIFCFHNFSDCHETGQTKYLAYWSDDKIKKSTGARHVKVTCDHILYL